MTMTDDDLERLLRRTYREIAARTDETTSPERPDQNAARSRRWQPVLAAAAVVAVVVGGLLALTNRGADAPAAIGEPRHIVPGWIPRADADDGDRRFALTEITSTADVDRLVWSADIGSVTLEYDRSATMMVTGVPATVRDAPAVRTPDGIEWWGPAGGVASLTIEGGVDPGVLDTITRSLVYVDDSVWSTLTATGGFTGDADRPLRAWRIEADAGAFDLLLRGNLHDGFSPTDGMTGWSLDLVGCRTAINYGLSDLRGEPDRALSRTTYTIVARGAPTEVVVSTDGELDRVVSMTSLEPTLDLSVGAIEYVGRSPSAGLSECEAIEP